MMSVWLKAQKINDTKSTLMVYILNNNLSNLIYNIIKFFSISKKLNNTRYQIL